MLVARGRGEQSEGETAAGEKESQWGAWPGVLLLAGVLLLFVLGLFSSGSAPPSKPALRPGASTARSPAQTVQFSSNGKKSSGSGLQQIKRQREHLALEKKRLIESVEALKNQRAQLEGKLFLFPWNKWSIEDLVQAEQRQMMAIAELENKDADLFWASCILRTRPLLERLESAFQLYVRRKKDVLMRDYGIARGILEGGIPVDEGVIEFLFNHLPFGMWFSILEDAALDVLGAAWKSLFSNEPPD